MSFRTPFSRPSGTRSLFAFADPALRCASCRAKYSRRSAAKKDNKDAEKVEIVASGVETPEENGPLTAGLKPRPSAETDFFRKL